MAGVRYIWDERAQTWVEATKVPRAQRVFVAGVGGKAGWPVLSDAMGVHPDQRQEAYEESVALGVPTEYNSKGQAVVTSESHRRKLAKGLQLHDRNCYNF